MLLPTTLAILLLDKNAKALQKKKKENCFKKRDTTATVLSF
jgi:hypothetical protein